LVRGFDPPRYFDVVRESSLLAATAECFARRVAKARITATARRMPDETSVATTEVYLQL